MPQRRPPLLVLALLVVLALVAGCSGGTDDERVPGDPVSEAEAEVLSEVLHRNFEVGGADFVVTAPYAEGAVLTLTGEVDFRRGTGRAQAVTEYADGRPAETRTLFFTGSDIWFGDVPGLAEELAAAGLPEAAYVRRPIAATGASGTASLIDVLVQMVPRLSARSADDPRSFPANGYTWQGTRSVNGELGSVFRSGDGATITVGAEDRLLLQYVTRLADQEFDVTITLTDHGEREIGPPADEETLDATAHPEVAAAVGV
ncbi:hypothetical protein [Modestobacter lapidis]|nr:hypothetical protein [Modestobacter lapidis]